MDCEAYRQAIEADPRGEFPGAAGHVAGCEACRALTAELVALDARIARALEIDAPALVLPPLPASASASPAGPASAARRARRMPAWLAAAAALATVAVLAFRALGPGTGDAGPYDALVQELLAHMDYEESSRVVTSIAVSDATLRGVLDAKVSRFDTGGPIVSYAMSCVIDGHLVPHLVVQGETGPITLILLPQENVDDVVPLSGENVHGFILPADTGSIAVIGQREEQMPELGEVGERVVQSVEWSI